MKSYLTIEGEYSHKIEVKHSVFICSIKGIDDFEEGMEFVKEISKNIRMRPITAMPKDNRQQTKNL